MSQLMDIYNEEFAKEAEQEEAAEQTGEDEIIQKYAEAADELLAEEYGEDYEANDVEKLAQMMIEHDLEYEQQREKVAEYKELGEIMARSFMDTLEEEGN